jgi:CubicO group peptidase (beta-lactamase class C family)
LQFVKPIDVRLLEDAAAYIDRWVLYRQRTLRVPGVAIGVGHRGRVVLAAAYGLADVEKNVSMTPEHIFRIASHSKMFTATAIMQLVEQGRVRLDDRIGNRLSWLPSDEGQLGRVTVRQLLSHSAGVFRDGPDGGFWQLEREFPDTAEFRELMASAAPVYPQNERFKYSNHGFSLLGLVIEEASGMPYNDYMRRSVVEPLGLRDTGPELDDHARSRLATGYSPDHYGLERLPVDHLDTHAMSPATGFYSTVRDLCRFGAAHALGSGELLSDESKREMQRQHWAIEGTDRGYCLGLDVIPVDDRRLVGHAGGFPGFITMTRIDPAEQLVVTALTNAGDGPAADLTYGMLKIINRAAKAATEPSSHPDVDRSRFAGRYWALGRTMDVARFGAELVGIAPDPPDPMPMAMELEVEGPDELRIAKAMGFQSPGERVRFTFDDAGAVRKVQWAAQTLYPWEVYERTIIPTVRATRRAPQRT